MSFMPLGTRLLKRSTDLNAELADLGPGKREAPRDTGDGSCRSFLPSPDVRTFSLSWRISPRLA